MEKDMRYYLYKKKSLEVHVFSYNPGTRECIDIHLTLMGVKSIRGFQVLNESYLFRQPTPNIYRISRHLFDICVFAYSRGMSLPFDISEIKEFASVTLKKRYEGVVYEKITKTILLNGL